MTRLRKTEIIAVGAALSLLFIGCVCVAGCAAPGGDLAGIKADIKEVQAAVVAVHETVAVEQQANRDAISKVSTTHGVPGWQLLVGFTSAFLASKTFNWLAARRRNGKCPTRARDPP